MTSARARDVRIPDDNGDMAELLLIPARSTPIEKPPSATPKPLRRAVPALYALWALGIVALFCLHFPHLLADFPNHSPWMDYSKYTDEGWYGNAAVRYHLTGHWFLHGDFNPGIALPVWPLLLTLVFHFTGVSLAADRALGLAFFGLNLILAYCIVRTQAERWAALLAVTLLATSPFLWAFSRLAILEPTLICFLLLSWLLALRLPRASIRTRTPALIAIGILMCLMVLTKTTAIFILPSTLFLIALPYNFRRRSLRPLAIAAAAAALPWCAWYFLLVRPHYRVDYQYLFDANHWPQPTTIGGWLAAFWYALHGTLWISSPLCLAAVALLLFSLIAPRETAAEFRPSRQDSGQDSGQSRNPVIFASLLAATGYIFFAGWHNSPQPRYYETVIYPLCFVLALGTAGLLRRSRPLLLRICGTAALAIMVIVSISGIFRIAGYLRHPEYTFLNAARGIAQDVDQHSGPHRLLLSISGDDIQMMTGLPAICDDYGTWDLPYRIHSYQPGWYATWNEVDPGTLLDLQTQYLLQRVAEFPAFDDPDRNVLILYRMVSLPASRQTYNPQQENADNAGK